MLYMCTKFHWNFSYGFQVIGWTWNCMENNQREITPKICKQELWFFSTTRNLSVLYKCTKFHWNNSYDFRVIKQTRNCMENNQREITHKILKPELWFLCMAHRLIMLNKCIKSYWKILNGFQVIQWTWNYVENNQREITTTILKPELWFLCMTHRLVMVYKCTKFNWKILNGFQVIQWTWNYVENNQREITPKILKPELWFLCMTHCLVMVYKCTKFHWKIFNGFQVIQRTRNCIENNRREITPKILKLELWFLCMTHRLVVVYKCTKFHWKIFNGFQVIQRTRNCIENNQRKITPKILKLELGSCAWHIVSSWFTSVPSFIEKSLTVFKLQSGHDFWRTDRQTDRQTDGRTDRRTGKNNMSPDPVGGRHN